MPISEPTGVSDHRTTASCGSVFLMCVGMLYMMQSMYYQREWGPFTLMGLTMGFVHVVCVPLNGHLVEQGTRRDLVGAEFYTLVYYVLNPARAIFAVVTFTSWGYSEAPMDLVAAVGLMAVLEFVSILTEFLATSGDMRCRSGARGGDGDDEEEEICLDLGSDSETSEA